jgi:hypothetical protein
MQSEFLGVFITGKTRSFVLHGKENADLRDLCTTACAAFACERVSVPGINDRSARLAFHSSSQ